MDPAAIDLETYDPMAPAVQQDPFPYYAALRERAPVYRHPLTGLYFVSRMATVNRVLSDPGTFSSRFANMGPPPEGGIGDELREILADGYPQVSTMLTEDPPLQTRYRKACAKAFSSRRILALEPRIRDLTDELIDAWPMRGRVELQQQFSVPLPVRVISHTLCMDPKHLDDIKPWSDASVAGLGVQISDEQRKDALRKVVEMQKYWASEFRARQEHPIGDLLSDFVQAEFEDADGTQRLLNVPELISIVQQLMVAGNETTSKVLNELVRLLVENPRVWERAKREPACIPNVVEEALRLSSPNQGLFRLVLADTELEGVKIPKGSMLWVMFGSANRDERVFPDPDRFDPDRPNLRENVAFGRGAHFCIGAPLARLELRVALERLAARIEDWSFAPGNEFRYEPSYILRGLERLELDVVRSS